MSEKERQYYNVDGGVVVTEVGNGVLARQTQIKNGFVVLGINDTPVRTLNDLQQMLAQFTNMKIQGFYPNHTGMYYYGLTLNQNGQ